MERTVEQIPGDTAGVTWHFTVLRFAPRSGAGGPSAYMQAALHANEQPGTSALHPLCAALRTAEAEGRLLGPVTVVPVANPVGLSQHLFGQQMGRFDTASQVNFNRAYPSLERPDAGLLDDAATGATALKLRLLALALAHDIVLDLHCDDESVPYIYIHHALWPAGVDLAAAIGAEAAILWDGPDGGGAFEEAALAPWLTMPAGEARLHRRVVSTVEFRGRADVSQDLGERDAAGLMRFLEGRGVIEPRAAEPVARFSGLARSIQQVTMVRAPEPGVIWFAVAPGATVAAGDRLATILARPGEEDGAIHVLAPHGGTVLTRRAHRYTRAGEDLLKLVGDQQSATYRPGTLEN